MMCAPRTVRRLTCCLVLAFAALGCTHQLVLEARLPLRRIAEVKKIPGGVAVVCEPEPQARKYQTRIVGHTYIFDYDKALVEWARKGFEQAFRGPVAVKDRAASSGSERFLTLEVSSVTSGYEIVAYKPWADVSAAVHLTLSLRAVGVERMLEAQGRSTLMADSTGLPGDFVKKALEQAFTEALNRLLEQLIARKEELCGARPQNPQRTGGGDSCRSGRRRDDGEFWLPLRCLPSGGARMAMAAAGEERPRETKDRS
ncbi:MAG: hypothetical protein HY721_33205, partial [Planctomycetes bacterium]|nr:hypothetical protein [Planctomycetota bacterium]